MRETPKKKKEVSKKYVKNGIKNIKWVPLYTGNKPPGIEIKKTVLFKIASNSKIPRNKANKGLKYLYCTWKTTRH